MSNDMKRLTAPRSWPVPRKSHVWITSPSPGPHSIEVSMPIMVIIRDMLHLATPLRKASSYCTPAR